MKKIKLFCLFLLATLSVWSQNEKQILLKTSVNLGPVLGENYQRVELSADEIRVADSLVNLYLPANYRHYDWGRKVDNYYEYYRQYAGYKEGPSANTIIYINAFRRKKSGEHYNKEEQFVSNKGGGSDYFRVKVDIQSKKCFDLSVNASK